jgi:site-specific recombinase XerD
MNTQPNTTQEYGVILQFPKPDRYVRPKQNTSDILNTFDNEIEYHNALPIRDKATIKQILDYYWNLHLTSYNTAQKWSSRKWNPTYLRNHRMFMIGFHCGLRISDLKVLQLGHFIREDGSYKEIFSVREQKTKNRKPDKETRTVYVTEEMIAAIETYKQYHPNWAREDYLFPNGYDENHLPSNEEMTLQNIDKMIKAMADKLEMDRRGKSSHLLRKTFAYHILQQVGNDDKGVRVLQKILGHSSFESTQFYLGITQQDMMDVCTKLHLG